MYPYRIESFGSGFLKDTAGNGNLRIMISSLHQRLVDHNCFPLLLEDHRTASNAGYSIYDFTQYTFEKKKYRFYINNCPTRCNTKQSIYYSASSLYMFRVSTTSIIRSNQNCNYSLWYWSYFLCSYLPPTSRTWPRWRDVASQYRRL